MIANARSAMHCFLSLLKTRFSQSTYAVIGCLAYGCIEYIVSLVLTHVAAGWCVCRCSADERELNLKFVKSLDHAPMRTHARAQDMPTPFQV